MKPYSMECSVCLAGVLSDMCVNGVCRKCRDEAAHEPQHIVPKWTDKPTCPGLWVYRVNNTFWMQSVTFQAHMVTQEHIANWVPRWGDDPIVEVYGPLPLSADGQKLWTKNERKIDKRLAKRNDG